MHHEQFLWRIKTINTSGRSMFIFVCRWNSSSNVITSSERINVFQCKHYHCHVNRKIIHIVLSLISCVQLFIMSLCKPLCYLLIYSYLLFFSNRGKRRGKKGSIHISWQKPWSSLSTQTFVDWNSSCFWQWLTPNHLVFESLLLLTVSLQCAAEHFIFTPLKLDTSNNSSDSSASESISI